MHGWEERSRWTRVWKKGVTAALAMLLLCGGLTVSAQGLRKVETPTTVTIDKPYTASFDFGWCDHVDGSATCAPVAATDHQTGREYVEVQAATPLGGLSHTEGRALAVTGEHLSVPRGLKEITVTYDITVQKAEARTSVAWPVGPIAAVYLIPVAALESCPECSPDPEPTCMVPPDQDVTVPPERIPPPGPDDLLAQSRGPTYGRESTTNETRHIVIKLADPSGKPMPGGRLALRPWLWAGVIKPSDLADYNFGCADPYVPAGVSDPGWTGTASASGSATVDNISVTLTP